MTRIQTRLLPDGTEVCMLWATEVEARTQFENRINNEWEKWAELSISKNLGEYDCPFPCPRPANIPDCVWPQCRCNK